MRMESTLAHFHFLLSIMRFRGFILKSLLCRRRVLRGEWEIKSVLMLDRPFISQRVYELGYPFHLFFGA